MARGWLFCFCCCCCCIPRACLPACLSVCIYTVAIIRVFVPSSFLSCLFISFSVLFMSSLSIICIHLFWCLSIFRFNLSALIVKTFLSVCFTSCLLACASPYIAYRTYVPPTSSPTRIPFFIREILLAPSSYLLLACLTHFLPDDVIFIPPPMPQCYSFSLLLHRPLLSLTSFFLVPLGYGLVFSSLRFLPALSHLLSSRFFGCFLLYLSAFASCPLPPSLPDCSDLVCF